MFTWHMAGLNTRLRLTVDMEAENAWNKLIAFRNGKDSVYKEKTSEASFVWFSGADQDTLKLGF